MQYSPKLKIAAEEIKAILEKHDIAGLVVLHTPRHAEYVMKVNPSYSCAKLENDGIRIKAKLQEDFNGDKKAWETTVRDTSNMLNLISEVGGKIILSVMELSKILDEKVDAYHGDSGHSSHSTQNN